MTYAPYKPRYCLYQQLCGVYSFEKKTRMLKFHSHQYGFNDSQNHFPHSTLVMNNRSSLSRLGFKKAINI